MQTLEQAKMQILINKDTAFYASLMLGMDVYYDGVPTARTNGSYIKINKTWFKGLNKNQRIFLLLHEILHTVYLHPFRMGDRDHKRWNDACDLAINYYLVRECNYHFIEGGLLDDQYAGMSAEQIYDLLPEDGGEDNVLDGDLEPSEGEDTEQQIQDVTDRLIQAQMQAQMVNQGDGYGNIPGDVLRQLQELLYPKLPWETLLDKYVTEKTNEDYSWSKRNRRYTDIIMPSLYSEQVGTVAIYVDASVSVSKKEFTQYMSEIMAIKEKLNPKLLEVISFDTRIQTIQVCTDGEELNIHLEGYGGTCLTEVAERVNENQADVNILFTDGAYRPVEYNKEVLHIIVGNKDYVNQDQPVIHVEI